jgi:hypothetical protein
MNGLQGFPWRKNNYYLCRRTAGPHSTDRFLGGSAEMAAHLDVGELQWVGVDNWILEAIKKGTCTTVTDVHITTNQRLLRLQPNGSCQTV